MTMSKTVPSVALALFVAAAIPAPAQTLLRPVGAEFRDSAAGAPLDEQNRDQNRENADRSPDEDVQAGFRWRALARERGRRHQGDDGQRRSRRRSKLSRPRAAAPPTTRGKCSASSTSPLPNAAVASK